MAGSGRRAQRTRAERTKSAPGASRALFWSFTNTAVSRLGTLGIGIVLARLLGPEAFGTYAVAFVALAAVLSFNELGVSLAIVRWKDDPKLIAGTVTSISVIGSVIVFVAGYFAAGPFATAMGNPEATGVVQLLLVSVLINGAVATPAALLQREFKQGTRMIVDQVNTWVGAGVSVALALLGFGAMSLAIGRIAGTVISAVMFVVYSPLPYRFGWNRRYVRPLLAFGLPLAGASIIVFAVGYADQLVVGQVLGSTALGFYLLAFNLSSWPVSMFSQPMRSVAPAAFSRQQHAPAEMRASFLSILRLLAVVAIPVCFFIAGAADPIVRFVYGEQWAPAAAALTWLAILAAFRIVFELAYDFLVIVKSSTSLFLVQVVWLIALVPGLIVGVTTQGIAGAGMAQLAVAALVVLPIYLWRLRAAGIGIRSAAARIAPALFAGIVVFGLSLVAAEFIDNPFLAAFSAGILALLVVAGLVYRDRATLRSLRSLGRSSEPVPATDADPRPDADAHHLGTPVIDDPILVAPTATGSRS